MTRFPRSIAVTSKRDGVVLAFDFGTRRVGVAIANTLTRAARPLATVDALGVARWTSIEKHLKDWAPTQLVVGIPRHPDGAAHDMTARAETFARQLEGRFRLPVARVDERYSTTEVADADDVDAAAAAVILQQWFASLPSPFKGGESGNSASTACSRTSGERLQARDCERRAMGFSGVQPIPTPDGAARGQARVVPAAQSVRSAKPRLHPLEGEGVGQSRRRREP